jgi:hypothetical protein
MSINVISINGKNSSIDYSDFEKSAQLYLKGTCSDASIFLFNNFPALTSTESSIDLLLIIAIEQKEKNYFRIRRNDKNDVYLYNLIIPIKIITNLQNEFIFKEDDMIVIDNQICEYSNEINSLKYGLIDYLGDKCGFLKNELFINPLIFIKNKNQIAFDNYLVSENLNFKSLVEHISKNNQKYLCSYKNWKTPVGFKLINNDVERIVNQASKDSATGYLTKKKIDRISKQLTNEKEIFNELNKSLIIIQGKAGTGKSSELLLLMMRCLKQNKNILYLTYNKLLIYDIAKTVKTYINSRISQEAQSFGEHPIMTLHAFFYRLSKSLGVLHLLSEARIRVLLSNLHHRTQLSKSLIDAYIQANSISVFNMLNLTSIKEKIQNYRELDNAEKEVGVDLVNYLIKNQLWNALDINSSTTKFISYKTDIIGNIEADKVFLADYYGVLDDTLLAINNPEAYFLKYDIKNKFELLEIVVKLNHKHLEQDIDDNIINEKSFIQTLNRKVGGNKRKRTLFIDEAQDCHYLEKEILYSIYGTSNIVIANGGKEQLIRHVELCNWEAFKNKKLTIKKRKGKRKTDDNTDLSQVSLFELPSTNSEKSQGVGDEQIYYDIVKFDTGRQSYRIKKNLLKFCNYVAEKYDIKLGLTPIETEDEGKLIFDFRKSEGSNVIKNDFDSFLLSGDLHGCTPYESLMILIDPESKILRNDEHNSNQKGAGVINEYGNIEDSQLFRKKEWVHKKTLEENLMFWDGATDDKNRLTFPSPNECRLIYYHSCRGLEAWAVACFNIDRFFEQKREDPDAEKFLLDEEKGQVMQNVFISNEQRKGMFAATWALMALTRAIDTMYLNFNDHDSEFSKLAIEYSNLYSSEVVVIK